MIYFALGAVCLLLILMVIYRRYIRPIRVIKRGMDLVREQDFASRLRHVGQRDADLLVDMFNRMMDALKHECLRVREQNEFLDLLISESSMGVILLGDDGVITSANHAAGEIFNCQELMGRRLAELESAVAREAAALPMRSSATVRLDGSTEILRISKSGFMTDGWLHPFVLVERLTDEIREAERRAFTRVIRVMAHEVNNSIGGIASTLEFLESEIDRQPDSERLLIPLRACRERAGSLIDFTKAYADVVRVPEPRLRLTDFYALTDALFPLLESICAHTGATLTAELDDAAPLHCDPGLISQVIVNVVKNAAESAGEGGHVAIHASGRTMTVTDDGPGISDEFSHRLFAEVFTTKPDGHGLGLMLVSEILRKHRWHFSLKTRDSLTRFTISAP